MSDHQARASEEAFLQQFAAATEKDALRFVLRFEPLLRSLLHRHHPDVPRYDHDRLIAETVRRTVADRATFRAGSLFSWRGHLHAVLRRVVAGLPARERS